MDEIDKKILKTLQHNGRVSIKDLSAQINLTPPAVSERIKRLENQGIILGYTAIIDTQKIGLSILALINVSMRADKHKEFYKFIRSLDSVTECYHVTGAYCMVVTVYCKSMTDLEHVVNLVQQYGDTNTLLVLSRPISQRPFF
ncbi:AsnC family transcriptional regulator [Lachnotalea glycerini]|uniref:AsnC family transcriptional regulator n=1 Tax=Lachnotalea glycerini TaxID=1763509 RepID=A0A318EMZ3_9FIRM|nr:Lrp/AsnC family transcriptional regulator [Lachnotalea glycerini]PXV86804.1 AsnC family transcriptional regulator [Lachnotalea glycerini]